MTSTRTTLVGLVVLITLATGPVAAATSPTFLVSLESDGDATIELTSTFDLSSDAEQQAFDEIRTNETEKAALADRFADRFSGVAQAASNATGRSMSVTDVSITLDTEGSTGIVTRSATWENLAAVDEDTLVVTEPFASEYSPDRTFVVEVPDGYDVEVTPSTTSDDGPRLTWAKGTDLSGFELTATEQSSSFPFNPVAALVGVLVAIALGAFAYTRLDL